MERTQLIYDAEISYTIDGEHPDRKYCGEDWTEDQVFTYSDTYYFNMDDEEICIRYMKGDLMLVAGGGYSKEHVHNVAFKFTKVMQ